jgi:FMN phosphatase YigB (HAD superfamily)
MMRSVASTLDGTAFFNMLKPPLDLRPFMLQLRARYRIGLATNGSATLPALLEHLKLRYVFDAIASVLDRVPPKPAPNILQLCMKRAGARPERSVYVGDSEIDRLAAQQAGVHFIAVGQRIDDHHRLTTIAELPAAPERLSANREDFPQTQRISDYSQNHFNKL